jgi:carboxymethylenebutenolidase
LDDFEHTVQYLLRRSQVLAGPVGLLGLSIGGRFAMNAVARFGHDIAAAAAVCPTGLELREAADPLYLALRKTSAALLFEFAEYDAAFQRATIPTFASFLQDNAAAVEAHVEAGTAHGYIFPSRPMYDHEASERSWERIIELFKRKLGR